MAEVTGIAWCDHTFNPWIGCTKVSRACDFCYAEALMDHRHHRVQWGGERSRTSASNWRQPIRWNRAAKSAGVRRKVFCASLADVFDNQVPEQWRDDLWELIAGCPDLDWLLLTKRPQNIIKMLPTVGARYKAEHNWPWPWVWIGTTAESQTEADRRLPHLLEHAPAAVHFVSVEPQLEPIDLRDYLIGRERHGVDLAREPGSVAGGAIGWRAPLDWVICGGESGTQARPFDVGWARAIRDQCATDDIPFFMKQMGNRPVGVTGITGKGDNPAEWPADLRIRAFPQP